MKRIWTKTIAGGALAAGLMLAQTTTPAPAPTPQPGQGRRGMRMNRQQRFERMATYLNLTADQRQQAQAIRDQARTAAQPVVAQLRAGRQQLAGAVKSGKSDAEIDRLATQQGVLQGQLIAIRTKAMEKGYALLTPDQKQKADQLRSHFRQMMQNRWRNNG